ncbi:MAG: ABC transporter transmembrane domain-containing protein [Burkholderiales bacterium]
MNVSTHSPNIEPRNEAVPVSRPAHFSGGKGSNFHRSLAVLRGLAPYARRHWRWLVFGGIAAIAVVASRLALPWPLRVVTDFSSGAAQSNWILSALPGSLDPVLAMGCVFFVLIFALGLSDLLERLYFARFSIGTVRDLRKDAIAAAVGARADERTSQAGDLVSPLVGDTARTKSGMQGFLVHVATNGMVFVGMTLILFAMHVTLGLIFAAARLATALVTAWATARIFQNSLRHRVKEGELADRIAGALETIWTNRSCSISIQRVETAKRGARNFWESPHGPPTPSSAPRCSLRWWSGPTRSRPREWKWAIWWCS